KSYHHNNPLSGGRFRTQIFFGQKKKKKKTFHAQKFLESFLLTFLENTLIIIYDFKKKLQVHMRDVEKGSKPAGRYIFTADSVNCFNFNFNFNTLTNLMGTRRYFIFCLYGEVIGVGYLAQEQIPNVVYDGQKHPSDDDSVF
ncbi:hypothetical protein ACJX0J_021889, partial [Zea mays]